MTSMLLRIWIWACSDIGRTAPTNLPDSISCNEGMPVPGSFSRSLRKLAKRDLLVESFSALFTGFLNVGLSLKTNWSRESIAHASPLPGGSLYHVVFNESLLLDWG